MSNPPKIYIYIYSYKKEDVIEIVSGLKMCRGLDPVHIEPIKVSQFCYEGVNQLYGNLPCDDTL